jgi:type IV secretory pathway TraG/TraD family ATPase VirD4
MNDELSKDHIEKMIAWQLQLDNLRFSNNKLRDKLAKAINNNESPSFLEEVENYHQKLLDLDQIMALMRHEILILLSAPNAYSQEMSYLQYHQMKTDIDRCEREFAQIAIAFKQPPFNI